MRARSAHSLNTLLAAAAAALCVAAPVAAADDSYGYFRLIEGSATLTQAGSGTRSPAEVNQPVLAGDRLWVPRHGRLEVVLSDRNLLRVDGDTELVFERLAESPDGDDRVTVLRLLEGEIQLVVRDGGSEAPRIDTPNATVYAQAEGFYRVEVGDEGWSQVVVRDGYAEVVTERGSVVVRADEEAWVDGERNAIAEVDAASARDALERWAGRLDDEARGDRYGYLDEDLRYEGSHLSRHGDWVNVDRSWAWRPRVEVGWRPYWQGRWSHTRGGLFWVSSEPWGWVPYHYGTWDYLPAHGWLWYPGRAFAPAWVYWYWGPSYVGWCPVGYYTRWYGHHYPGFRSGVYGWIGGDWGSYSHWSFVDHRHFGGRDLHRHARSGRDLRDTRPGGPGRGVLTTDTRDLTPDRWGDPRGAQDVLTRRTALRRLVPSEPGVKGLAPSGELPDVTPFVERRRELPPEVRTRVVTDRPEGPDGSPLRPMTLGRPRIDPDDERGAAGERRVITGTPREREAAGEAERRVITSRPREGDSGEEAGRRVITSEPREPSEPATGSGGDEAWRVRGRTDDGGPRAIRSRPTGEGEGGGDAGAGDESWRGRGDDGDDGDGAQRRVITAPPARPEPERPASESDRRVITTPRRSDPEPEPTPPASDSGARERPVRDRDDDRGGSDGGRTITVEPRSSEPEAERGDRGDRGEARRARERDEEPPRVLGSRPTSGGGDEGWRTRGRSGELRPAPQVDRRTPPAGRDTSRDAYRAVTPDRGASAPRPEVRALPSRPTYSRPEARREPARPAPRPEVRSAPPRSVHRAPEPSPPRVSSPQRGSEPSGRSASPRSRSSERSSPPPARRGRSRSGGGG